MSSSSGAVLFDDRGMADKSLCVVTLLNLLTILNLKSMQNESAALLVD